jgi:hypothetical protein
MTDQRYWIAINGSSCALSSLPFRNPMLIPTPEQMLGFPTRAEKVQRLCLQAPMDEMRKLLAGLAPDVTSGRVRVIRPEHPQPSTRGPTMWTESEDVHQPAESGRKS